MQTCIDGPQKNTGTGRREALAAMGGAAVAGLAFTSGTFGLPQTSSEIPPTVPSLTPEAMGWDSKTNQYILPPLPYKAEALEPHIDKQTMELHHDRHHQSYVDGLNKALKMLTEIRAGSRDASEIKHWSRELAFHGSGHFLHVLFWNSMGPVSRGAGGRPRDSSAIAKAIDETFGSFKQFSDQFQAASVAVEGGGWGILVRDPVSGRLLIMQAEKHQNLTAWGVQPLLPVDVWEHAYYLKYQNKRKDYVAAFMNVINWAAVDQRYAELTGKPAR
jgi:Fe-Mn family superoxide dismutase